MVKRPALIVVDQYAFLALDRTQHFALTRRKVPMKQTSIVATNFARKDARKVSDALRMRTVEAGTAGA